MVWWIIARALTGSIGFPFDELRMEQIPDTVEKKRKKKKNCNGVYKPVSSTLILTSLSRPNEIQRMSSTYLITKAIF